MPLKVAVPDLVSNSYFPAVAAVELGLKEEGLIANGFENVYSFALARPTEADRPRFACPWLVAMSAKNNGPARVGSGHYDWQFSSDVSCLVEKLIVTIDVMQVLPAKEIDGGMEWGRQPALSVVPAR